MAAVTLATGLAIASTGWASPTYPAEIEAHLQLSYQALCTICHTTMSGGTGTATTKFATSMKAAGLTGQSQLTLLDSALDTLAAKNTDSDGDGVSDIQALKDRSDPNTGQAQSDVPAMRYGCGARIATGKVQSNAAVTVAMACLGLVLLGRLRTWRIAGHGNAC